MKRSPWWFCTGWWSPWCVIDAIAHCKVSWICKRHDDAQVRWFDRHYSDPEWDVIEAVESTVAVNLGATTTTGNVTYSWTLNP